MTMTPDGALMPAVVPNLPITTVQVADFPGVYAVRRGGPAEAIIHRGEKTGDWYVMFGLVSGDGGDVWQHTATLSGSLDQAQAADLAVELVDAAAHGPTYAELFARLLDVGGAVAYLGRLHCPDKYGDCAGDNVPESDDRVRWVECETVKILAGTVGYVLPH